ncbi:Poly [ADP-ribose] polymerase 1 [Ceratocystis fimbriata CBS 114723]|uniref:Poly [ADP-ribose] polymerase n=1 Tax=Ceratocystis fimbriata CBS 114723 TaxID=1035309 RepID=A0A2C5X8F9_9PEZI|nr:Poly [ADP-ribose] polymerase 1 [Ceratocystis fimbriata CBS 114723]
MSTRSRSAAAAAAAAAAATAAAQNSTSQPATLAGPKRHTVLEGCAVAISGVFPGYSHSTIETLIKDLGGTITKSVTRTTTHLVTTQHDFDNSSIKVQAAVSKGLPVVSLEWVVKASDELVRQREAKFEIGATSASHGAADGRCTPPPAQAPEAHPKSPSTPTGTPAKKRGSPDAKTVVEAPRKKRARATKKDTIKEDPEAKGKSEQKPAAEVEQRKEKEVLADGQIAKSDKLVVPLDNPGAFPGGRVYIDQDGLIYDASLNQTNASNNNNKFYRLQIIETGNNNFTTWFRWGRVGESGQFKRIDNSLERCIREFKSKFKSKSGYPYPETGPPKPGSYVFVEKSYEPDDDDEDSKAVKQVKDNSDSDSKEPESKLERPIQQLVELIFNTKYFTDTMKSMNYDATKLPLGKLSKNTITRGFETLKRLAEVLDDQPQAINEFQGNKSNAIEYLSNAYYSVIPHAFGRNRPPIINSGPLLKCEVDMLESLSDMKVAEDIMKVAKTKSAVHHLDHAFEGLNLKEITTLDPESSEFLHLSRYLHVTRGSTHRVQYDVQQIFRIERPGEYERFENGQFRKGSGDGNSKSERRLLWHGSRCTNFGGILSQGLRIAPPEAPVSGYMFGKGIYLADMSSKSANYCFAHASGGHALLLLCEAELGPMQELTRASYEAGETAAQKGMGSTWGHGLTAPPVWKDAGHVHPSLAGVRMPDTDTPPAPTNVPHASLLYNEFIVYNVAQVRLRYLFRVRMR